MASPSVSFSADAKFSWGTTGAPVIRDHRTHVTPVAYEQRTRTQQLQLAGYLSLANGRDVLRMPGMNLRDAEALTLRATYGAGYVQGVQVRYKNGSSKNIQLNQWMSSRSPAIKVPLHGNRAIESIVIFGSAEGRLNYQVFAQLDNDSYEMPRPPVYQPPVYRGMSIGDDLTFMNTDGRKFLTVGAEKGKFSSLRISGSQGNVFIQHVKVTFADGQEQLVTGLNKSLRAGESYELALENRRSGIQQITIWTHDRGHMVQNITGSFDATLF
jgi:hypothetical protein